MNLFEFSSKISSIDSVEYNKRIGETSTLHCLLSSDFTPEDIKNIQLVEDNTINVDFSDNDKAAYAAFKFNHKNVPGVMFNGIYKLSTNCYDNRMTIKFDTI